MLLAKGADPNVRTKRNESALADAATAGNQETVKLLQSSRGEWKYPGYPRLLAPCILLPGLMPCPPVW